MSFISIVMLQIGAYLAIGLFLSSLAVKHRYIPKEFALASAFAFIGLIYYIVFFVSLRNPGHGKSLNTIIYLVGGVLIVYGLFKLKYLLKNKNFKIFILLPLTVIVVALSYYTVLLKNCQIPTVSGLDYSNSAYCYLSKLPGDNSLPLIFAQNIEERTPKSLVGGWNLVDRPPIQIGVGLGVLQLSGKLPAITESYQVIATYLQLSWIAAIFGLLITLGLRLRDTLLITGTMIFTGVLFINSIFVWPKLFAGSLALVGCVLLLDFANKNRAKTIISSMIFIVISLLIHDAVIFTILGLAAVLIYIYVKNKISNPKKLVKKLPLKPIIMGCLISVIILTPWMIYKDRNSTSDRLTKWEFAGVVVPNNKPTLSTIINSYESISINTWLKTREINTKTMIVPELNKNIVNGVKSFGFSKSSLRSTLSNFSAWFQVNDFYVLLFTFGFFNLGWIALLFKKNPIKLSQLQKHLLEVSLIGLVFWVVLIFIPGLTIIHVGSYATLLLLFGLLGTWLARTKVLYALFFIQFLLFNLFWIIGNYPIYNLSLRKSLIGVISSVIVAAFFILICEASGNVSLPDQKQRNTPSKLQNKLKPYVQKLNI
ncbi:MAG TPA: hypothetical protein VMR34_00600 [Candidatus Saccharimonadales bacterium]|nr:hypothetical protein [Candidatus Saccharimonadales bacterium]